MSEYKPITGELRDWFEHAYSYDVGETPWFGWKSTIEQMLDAIDSIHAGLERENAELKTELDRARGECDYWESTSVELPKDAHDVHIFAGDKLDGYGKTIEVVELRYGRSGWVLISRDGNAYADTFAFTHHHAPTVEDVLREMLDAWGELPSNATNDAIVAEYAKRLTLAGDAE